MAPVLLVAGDGEGGGESSGMRRMLLVDRPDTPAGFHAPPPDMDSDYEEDFEMATNGERITALEEKVSLVAVATADIPGIKETQVKQGADVAQCKSNTAQILAILQGAGMVAPTAADAGTGGVTGTVAVNNPTAQLVNFLMPAIKQLPPQIILLFVAYLLFTGKLTG